MSGMMDIEVTGGLIIEQLGPDFIESVSASATKRVSEEFAGYLRQHGFDKYYENQTGETRDSIQAFRKKGNSIVYAVKAGYGITGSLNYLAGLYRGKVNAHSRKTKSGKTVPVQKFSYCKPRPFLQAGWKDFGGSGRLKQLFEETFARRVKEAGA